MVIKRLSIMLLAVLFLISISACDSNKNKNSDAGDNKGNSTLRIYYTNYDTEIPNALNIFKEKHKDITVEEKYFSDINEYKNKITMDILSGEGPDVILIRPMYFESINKLISNGVLCDLNELIRKDKDFKMADYNEKVLNAFEQDGKRFIIPLRYAASAFITSKGALKRNNIEIDPSNWTYEEFLKIADKYMANNKGNKKYFICDFDIKALIKGTRTSFVDFINKKSGFNSTEFIEILEIYKRLYPAIWPEEELKARPIDKMIKNDAYIMLSSTPFSQTSLFAYYSMYRSIGEEMTVYPFPVLSGDNNSSFSYAEEAVAVNSQSKNKEAAFNFIKIIMSEECQKLEEKGFSTRTAIPVNKKAYESDFEYFIHGYDKNSSSAISMRSGDYSFSAVNLPNGYKTVLDNILSNVDRCEIPEEEIFKVIKDEMPDFLDGKRTAAQTAKLIDDKVNLYLNE